MDKRTRQIDRIARILVDDWFKTDDRESVFQLLIGKDIPLSKMTDEQLAGYDE